MRETVSQNGLLVRSQKEINMASVIITRRISEVKSQGFDSRIPLQLMIRYHNSILPAILCHTAQVVSGLIVWKH